MTAKFSLKALALRNKFRIRRMKPIQSSSGIESEYYAFLRSMSQDIKARFLKAFEKMSGPRIRGQWQDDDWSDRLESLISEITKYTKSAYSENALIDLIRRFIFKTDQYHSFWYRKAAMYGFGFDISKLPEFEGYRPFIKAAIEKNLSIVKSFRGEAIYRTEIALRTAIERGKSIAQVRNEIMASGEVSKRKAALVARNEIKNITSQLEHKRSVNAGFTTYEWLTSEDQRVRGNPSGWYPKSKTNHWIMNGLYCKYDDPTVYSADKGKTWKKRTGKMPIGEPGTCDINCRCVSAAIA